MGKPNGIALGMTREGPTMNVTRPSRAEDAVWDAVQEARMEGWSAKRFRREAETAWAEDAKRDAEAARSEARRAFRD